MNSVNKGHQKLVKPSDGGNKKPDKPVEGEREDVNQLIEHGGIISQLFCLRLAIV